MVGKRSNRFGEKIVVVVVVVGGRDWSQVLFREGDRLGSRMMHRIGDWRKSE